MKSLKECLLESQVNESKYPIELAISDIEDQGDKYCSKIISSSLKDLSKIIMLDDEDTFADVIDSLVLQVIGEIGDWKEDILDYNIEDAGKCLVKFIADRVEVVCDNIYSSDDNDYEQVIDNNYDIAEVIWKYTAKLYKIK